MGVMPGETTMLTELDRTISPRFPTIAEGNELRRRKRAKRAAWLLVVAMLFSLVFAVIDNSLVDALVGCAFFAAFIALCWTEGSHHGAYGNGLDVPGC